MIDDEALAEFIQRFTEPSEHPRTVFTPEIVKQIGEEFSIPIALREVVGLLLEAGAEQWRLETQRAALDFAKIRKELSSLERAATAIGEALKGLSSGTQRILIESGVGRSLGGFPVPCISMDGSSPVLTYTVSQHDETRCIPLHEVASILASLGQCAVDARPTAGANRKGRPEGEALLDLLHAAYQVWETVLGRAFKLDWASDGEPITDAARFSVRIARVIGPTQTLQQIATASRKVREKGMPIKDLSEVPKVMEHYRKQFE